MGFIFNVYNEFEDEPSGHFASGSKERRVSLQKPVFYGKSHILVSFFHNSINQITVNSLVTDHPAWCTTEWSITGSGLFREKSRK